MKLAENTNNVVRGGINTDLDEVQEIEMNAKMFEILAGGMYSDQISAVMRELGCNAADSHVWAGKSDVPFVVHLPNSMEPWLSIKDEGVGMNDVEIRTVWKKWGKSNKTESSDQTGAWGLGSKSPYGYGDSYTVIATKDGARRTYNCYIDEERLPRITKVAEATECVYADDFIGPKEQSFVTGVEVIVPIKSDDLYNFQQRAKNVFGVFGHTYSNYNTRPIIVGCADFKYHEADDYLIEGDDYAVSRETGCGSITKILMGNVAYPINVVNMDSNVKEKLTKVEEALLSHGVTIYVPLEDAEGFPPVTPAGGREALQMNARTIATIKKRLAAVAERIADDVQADIAACSSVWQARLVYQSKIKDTVLGRIQKLSEADPIEFNGIPVAGNVSIFRYWEEQDTNLTGLLLLFEEKDGVKVPLMKSCKEKLVNMTAHQCSSKRRSFQGRLQDYKVSTSQHQSIQPDTEVELFVNDGPTHHMKRMEHYMLEKQKCGEVAYLVSEIEGENNLDQWLEDTGLCEIARKVSELPLPVKTHQKRVAKTAKAVICTGTFDYKNERTSWDDHEIDLDEGGVYVEVRRYKWSAGDLIPSTDDFPNQSPARLENYYKLAKRQAGYDGDMGDFFELIGLRKQLADKVKNDPNWIRLDDYLVMKTKQQYIHADKAHEADLWASLKIENKGSFASAFSEAELVNGVFKTLVDELQGLQIITDSDDVRRYQELRNVLSDFMQRSGSPFPELCDNDARRKELERQRKELDTLYPMFHLVSNNYGWNGSVAKHVASYVGMVDCQRAIMAAMPQLQADGDDDKGEDQGSTLRIATA